MKKSIYFFCFISLLFLFSIIIADDDFDDRDDDSAMPLPFTRELYMDMSLMSGNDVIILQTLIKRSTAVNQSLVVTGKYDHDTAEAVSAFQAVYYDAMKANGLFDPETAKLVLELCSDDGIKDTGFTAKSLGYKYKIHIPITKNATIETMGTLFDADNNVLLKFHARSHGLRDDATQQAWPDYGDSDNGLNQFSSSGNTITGIIEIDLNTPEPDPEVYGPWPVNRFVKGLSGNAALLLPNIRDGLLLHTGNWYDSGWKPNLNMPNSNGCVHSHPNDVERIYKALLSIGVIPNENPFSGKNYPFKPQGIAVVELIN